MPFYVVDDGRNGWTHIADLAAKSGFLARFAPDGSLDVGPASEGSPAQSFTFAQDVLALDAAEQPPAAGAITVVGEGAAGSQGDAAWSWLVKDPSGVTGTAGSGDPARLVRDHSLRTLDAASGAAEAASATAAAGAMTARLLVPGAPKATVGATVAVTGTPDGTLDGTYVVRGVRHRYAKREGFTSLLLLGRGGGAAGGGLASLAEASCDAHAVREHPADRSRGARAGPSPRARGRREAAPARKRLRHRQLRVHRQAARLAARPAARFRSRPARSGRRASPRSASSCSSSSSAAT